jgi:hypothetical protein
MTSLSIKASRTRAGMLVVALALVGGTGCITTAIVQNAQYNKRVREAEAARQDSIARLAPAAEAGDPVAQTKLARALLANPAPGQVDQQRVFARLNSAADQGYGPAQALLGEILVTNAIETADSGRMPLAPAYQDRERGFRLLMQAASQACIFQAASAYQGVRWIHPAWLLGSRLALAGRFEEAMVWRVRSDRHCGTFNAQDLANQATSPHATPPERVRAFAGLLLAGDSARIARVEPALSADELTAARSEAAELRRRLAQSEQQYPAPRRKEMQ